MPANAGRAALAARVASGSGFVVPLQFGGESDLHGDDLAGLQRHAPVARAEQILERFVSARLLFAVVHAPVPETGEIECAIGAYADFGHALIELENLQVALCLWMAEKKRIFVSHFVNPAQGELRVEQQLVTITNAADFPCQANHVAFWQ